MEGKTNLHLREDIWREGAQGSAPPDGEGERSGREAFEER